MELGSAMEIERKLVEPGSIQAPTKYVGLEHIESTGGLLNAVEVQQGDLASTKFAFTPRHILYGKLRPYLSKIARPAFSGVCSTDILPLRPKEGTDRDYLFYYLRQPRMIQLATQRSIGANLPRLSPRDLAKFPFIAPEISEQKRIVAVLDGADALRRKQTHASQLAADLIPAIFYEMFGDPYHNPHAWPVVTFAEIIADGPQNGLYRPASDYGDGIRILRIDSFYDGEVRGIDSLKRVRIDAETASKFALHEGDIVINRVNSRPFLGKSAIIPALDEHTVFESNMMRLSLHRDRADPQFMIAMLQQPHIRRQILQRCKDAVNQSSINQEDVKSFEFPLPPPHLQRAFAERASKVREVREKQDRAQQMAADLFDSLAQRAFKGEL